MTYKVFGGTLSLTQSINQSINHGIETKGHHSCCIVDFTLPVPPLGALSLPPPKHTRNPVVSEEWFEQWQF